MSTRQHERLATEARLHQMSTHQHERLTTESSKERGARLHQMSMRQHGQLKSPCLASADLLSVSDQSSRAQARPTTGPA